MRRAATICALLLVTSLLLGGCATGGKPAPGPVAPGSAEPASANGELATQLNGAWISSGGQTLEWTLTGDKGTVVYVESFDGVDPAQAKEFTAQTDVSGGTADFEYGNGANIMRVRYLGAGLLIAERVAAQSGSITSCDIYARSKDAAVQAVTAFTGAMPEYSGAVVTKKGESSYYERLVSEGLLVAEDNAITAPN